MTTNAVDESAASKVGDLKKNQLTKNCQNKLLTVKETFRELPMVR